LEEQRNPVQTEYSMKNFLNMFRINGKSYPTIFALGIRGLGEHTKFDSSLIVMAIVGGALMPPLMGWIADADGMRIGFVMPLVCFVYVMFYAAFWGALERLDTGHEVAD
jgi:FHS family L-fucose permease-like MFS transporter